MLKYFVMVLWAAAVCFECDSAETVVPSTRPSADERTWSSTTIDDLIADLKPLLLDPDVAQLLENCLPNTLDTTVHSLTVDPSSGRGVDSFVITGDITALWLRDSANQVLPYVPYARNDARLTQLLQGLVARHARSVLIDPFANAFNYNASQPPDNHANDVRTPPMTAAVFEGKYEIDSLLAFFKLSYWYVEETHDTSVLTDDWLAAADMALRTVERMMEVGQGAEQPYAFQRETEVATDTLAISGLGAPGRPGIGMSRQLFRPSDDAVTFPYNVPGNAMACVEVGLHLPRLLARLGTDGVPVLLAARAVRVGETICSAVDSLLKASEVPYSASVPYEVDGYGSRCMMDDANVPSLLSLPILGVTPPHSTAYKKARAFVLSPDNPFFFKGTAAEGVGGPHQGYAMAWPMAITVRAMTSTNDDEVRECLDMLKRGTAGTGLMHESFNVNDPYDYTRDWFAWANGLFGEMVLQLVHSHPHLVLKPGAGVRRQALALVRKPVSLKSIQEAERR
jgi:meiotically up-regulated gene 157 (Mug157) protein